MPLSSCGPVSAYDEPRLVEVAAEISSGSRALGGGALLLATKRRELKRRARSL